MRVFGVSTLGLCDQTLWYMCSLYVNTLRLSDRSLASMTNQCRKYIFNVHFPASANPCLAVF